MRIESERRDDGIVILTLHGPIATEDVPRLEDALDALAENPERIAIDMTSIDHLYSAAIGCLIAFRERIQEVGGRVVLASLRPSVAKIIERVGSAAFERHDTLASAIHALTDSSH